MEIQSAPIAIATTNASSSTGAGATATGTNSFNIALSGVMASDGSTGASGKGAGSGLSALIQMLAPMLAQGGLNEEQMAGLQLEQLDGLIGLLEQADAAGQGNDLLQIPELQSWLQDLQSLLAQMTAGRSVTEGEESTVPADRKLEAEESDEQGDALALNPMLFVPLTPHTVTADGGEEVQAPIDLHEALHMLKQLKELAVTATKEPSVQQTLKELPSVLLHAAAQLGETNQPRKDHTTVQQQSLANTGAGDASATDEAVPVQVIPQAMQKLEVLATRHQAIQMALETTSREEAPLFELLPSDHVEAEPPVPMTVNDWMKQNATSHQAARTAVLQMPAATFSDEMTKFVVSSFVLGTSVEGVTEARISLYPQHLGHVEVKLTMHNGQLIAQFMADSLTGKEMLEGQLSQLRTSLQAQGIQVDKLEVSQSQSYQSGMFQEGRQQQPQSQKQQKSNGKDVTVEDVKAEEEALASRLRLAGNEGSIDFTA
ncbi:flagellar hook-length control protein FliK [Paenibacillus puerhi]|uniref:flagellar hook-length control protein FliK n=1 Tax=Paenibacillus puerhi TaxID=2692622 RepID=UPI00135AFB17|nr:flagellar hook-length control protein FliK [Paenibacillus puerhi]